jgi:hypothetical protein
MLRGLRNVSECRWRAIVSRFSLLPRPTVIMSWVLTSEKVSSRPRGPSSAPGLGHSLCTRSGVRVFANVTGRAVLRLLGRTWS